MEAYHNELILNEMCKVIEKSGILVFDNGENPTASEIFNYNLTGELWQIFFWYEEAKALIESRGVK